jgi:hypothetical protein
VIVSLEKPGTPQELVHHGIRGMKWGVRKRSDVSSQGSDSSSKEGYWTPERKSRAKKVAIGVGVLTAVAGASYVAYRLHKDGKLPLSSIRKASGVTHTPTPEVKKVIEKPTSIIHLARGKTKGLAFQQQGGTPSHFNIWEKTLGKYAHDSASEIFEKHGDLIAARFKDPLGRLDFSGRPIHHEVIIPNTMTHGINNIEDVKQKIWPLLKNTYDYT